MEVEPIIAILYTYQNGKKEIDNIIDEIVK